MDIRAPPDMLVIDSPVIGIGRVGIGTDNPTSTLHVEGDVRIDDPTAVHGQCGPGIAHRMDTFIQTDGCGDFPLQK